jgi:hypothetical protein
MEKKQNTTYLLKQWIPVIILWIILLFGIGGLIRQGSYLPVIVFTAITIGVIVFLVSIRTFSKINRLLKASSPQSLIDHYDKGLGRSPLLPNKDAILAGSKSLIYTLYGDFENARIEANKVNWEQKPPLLKSQRFFLEALWAYLEAHDFQQGLSLAKEARRLVDGSSSFPGAKRSLGSYDMVIEIGELLSGNSEPNIVHNLEQRLQKFPVMMKLVAAWGLEGFYNQSGQAEKARKMRELLTSLAPYCKGLTSL